MRIVVQNFAGIAMSYDRLGRPSFIVEDRVPINDSVDMKACSGLF